MEREVTELEAKQILRQHSIERDISDGRTVQKIVHDLGLIGTGEEVASSSLPEDQAAVQKQVHGLVDAE